MFRWSIMRVMNEYVDNVCIFEDDTNSPKQNVPSPLLFPYPKIYSIIVPWTIRYSNTSHFIVIFFDAVHPYEYHFS